MIPLIFMYYFSVHRSILPFENIPFTLTYYPSEQFKVPRYFIFIYRDKKETDIERVKIYIASYLFADRQQTNY